MPSTHAHGVVAIIPCNDLDVSEAFYAQLGFRRGAPSPHDAYYRILADDAGARLHLTATEPGWVDPPRNPFGIYFYTDAVDELAARVRDHIIEPTKAPSHKHWGMYEFSLSDPNGTLVRIGRLSTP